MSICILLQQSFRQNINNQANKGRPKTTIKFESDFDFEQANTKFEEVRLSLAKLKVGEEVKPADQQVEQVLTLFSILPNFKIGRHFPTKQQ